MVWLVWEIERRLLAVPAAWWRGSCRASSACSTALRLSSIKQFRQGGFLSCTISCACEGMIRSLMEWSLHTLCARRFARIFRGRCKCYLVGPAFLVGCKPESTCIILFPAITPYCWALTFGRDDLLVSSQTSPFL